MGLIFKIPTDHVFYVWLTNVDWGSVYPLLIIVINPNKIDFVKFLSSFPKVSPYPTIINISALFCPTTH